MSTLFLAWQNPQSRQWYPVGRMDHVAGRYRFVYTQGAERARQAGFSPLLAFPDLDQQYESKTVFPLFENRVMGKNRPDYAELIRWLSLAASELEPVAILARTGGESATDTLEVFPLPQPDATGRYDVHFFVRGLRHQAHCSLERVQTLQPDERLRIMPDPQNSRDEEAVMLRTAETTPGDMHLLGYLPRYLAHELARQPREVWKQTTVQVVRVNPPPAPVQFRLLCRLAMPGQVGQPPFSGLEFQPWHSTEVSAAPP